MQRLDIFPRPDWRQRVESQGLLFHTQGGTDYWWESACYVLSSAEVDELEAATAHLYDLCLKGLQHVFDNDRLAELDVPAPFHGWLKSSWEHKAPAVYGRFDLVYDGQSPPRLLEFNADTPTALVEAAVVQWYWLEDQKATLKQRLRAGDLDQFNSIHERLIEAWRQAGPGANKVLHVAAADAEGSVEDFVTAQYMRDVAQQAGWLTDFLPIEQIGFHPGVRQFVDLQDRPIRHMFKLYPWEWLFHEEFGQHLLRTGTFWFEPPWKAVLSNKGFLAILSQLFPGDPHLLATSFEPRGGTYVEKPFFSREGSNITIVNDDRVMFQTGGAYGQERRVYQEYAAVPRFDGKYAVIGSWVIGGEPAGVGVREDDGPVTGNASRFVPHCFTP